MDKKKIITHFGEEFYQKILYDLGQYAKLWNLSDFEQIDYYSINCIFKCVSDKHGLCILKIGKPSNETKTEYHILKEYNGRRFCKIYEADIYNGILLIERIMPGMQLRAESNLDKRLDLFSSLLHGLHAKPIDKSVYPTYMGWVSRITEYMRGRKDYEKLYGQMAKAEQICRTLCKKYTGEMLLHGDLHHDNILLAGDNHYCIIDPKGVVGDIVFDIPRFILNEFEEELNDDFYKKIIHITRTLSCKLSIPESDIRRLIYVEMCMSESWNVESGQIPVIDNVMFAEKLMDEMTS